MPRYGHMNWIYCTKLDRKKLGLSKLIVGENIPDSVVREGDGVIECQGLTELGDERKPNSVCGRRPTSGFFSLPRRGGFNPIHRLREGLLTA